MLIHKGPGLHESADAFTRFVLSGINPPQRIYELEKKATEFGIPLSRAVGARRAYLWKEWDFYLNAEVDSATWDVICKPALEAILKELYQLKRDMHFRSRPLPKGTEITPEMKSRARAVPVTSIVEFTNGRAKCWMPGHEDKRPSLYLAPKINKVVCPSCSDKKGNQLMMDPIDILCSRDGLSFFDAIKKLQ